MKRKTRMSARVAVLCTLVAAVLMMDPVAVRAQVSVSPQVVINGQPAVAGEVLVKFRRSLNTVAVRLAGRRRSR